MIRLMVETEIIFKNNSDLENFVNQDAVKITGFAAEIVDAYENKKQVIAKTPRPKLGTITRSFVNCYDLK